MVSSVRQVFACIVLLLGSAACIAAQTATQKVATASISGKVTIKNKPAVGVTILATDTRVFGNPIPRPYRARTDQTGSYRITNLAAGTYEVSAATLSLVPTNQPSIVVSEGDEIEDVNLALVPGGVITGKITDSEGEPIIGIQVNLMLDTEQLPNPLGQRLLNRLYSTGNSTDDRGIYRVFGLPAGKYRVSVGQSGSGPTTSREYYKLTFYPSVTDAAKAAVIEVTEGSETDHVDIVITNRAKTFRVAGRVIDGETARPVTNLRYGWGQRYSDGQGAGSSTSISGEVTGTDGGFRLGNVTPGKYTVFTIPPDGSDMLAGSVTFDVVDRDLTDLLIKTTKGSSLSGVVVLENNESAPAVLSNLRIYTSIANRSMEFAQPPASAVAPDGTFNITGLRSGPIILSIHSPNDTRRNFSVVRVERNGIPTPEIDVKEREHVAGIRVVVKYVKLTGAIRGQVKVAEGELPPVSRLSLMLWPLDENLQLKRMSSLDRPQLDARGRFVVEGLPAGVYRLTVHVMASEPTVGRNMIVNETTEQVTVTDDTTTEVTLTLKPRSNPN
jgi:carboxypeptidase family protein